MDLFPHDQLGAETFWKTEGDIQMGVAGVYSTIKSDALDFHRYRVDNITDNSWQWTNGGSSGIVQRGSIEPTTGGVISTMYNANYKGIAACNNFMKNFPTAKVNAKISEAKANEYEAEIRFLRALFYFDLVYFYGDVPLYKEAIESVEASKVKQSPASEIYAFIKEDIDFAIEYLPATAYGSGHAVKGSAQALKARIALFQSDWNTVESVTKEIISSGTYKLADSYWSIFIKREGQKNNPEILFSVTYLNPDIRHNAETEYYYQCEIEPMDNLMKCYDPEDVRLKEWYVNVGLNQKTFENPFGETATVEQGSQTGWLLLKHMDKYRKETYSLSNYDFRTDNDIILLRYADVYLMYIEAMVEKGSGNTTDALALKAMNEIRTRAGLAPAASISRDLLRLERRRELAFEGLRHFDLVRWRTAKEVMTGLDTPMGPCLFYDHYYTWPFPQSEMDINPQLDQKPGYL
jgi:hypothetical protein